MKKVRNIALLIGAFCLCTAFTHEKKQSEVYLFGVATSFNDTLVHFTDIQPVEGAAINKQGFLEARNQYAYQLKNYLENVMSLPNRTCAVFFHTNKSKLEKDYSKLRKKYVERKDLKYETLPTSNFQFKTFKLE